MSQENTAEEIEDNIVEAEENTEEVLQEEPEEIELAIEEQDVRLVEAILFAAAEPLAISTIAERFPEQRRKLVADCLDLLKERYANSGVNLVERENRWALRTATDLADALRVEKEQHKKLSRAAQETLAVIAYHQPVTRAEIENIRGVVTSGGTIDTLMEAGWIKPGKRREVPGRPLTWLTTQQFLDHFGLDSLESLPGIEDLKAAGLLDKRPAIEAMPKTSDLFSDGDENADDDAAAQAAEDADFEEHYAAVQVEEDTAQESPNDSEGENTP